MLQQKAVPKLHTCAHTPALANTHASFSVTALGIWRQSGDAIPLLPINYT